MTPSAERALTANDASRTRVVLWLTIALTTAPVLLDLLVSGHERVFDYMAADAFYYMTVARNIAEHGAVSFDQVHSTNGFHPLWQALSAGLYWMGSTVGLAAHHILSLVVVVQLALLGAAIWFVGRAMAVRRGLSIAFATLPVGAYAALAAVMWLGLGESGLLAQRGAEGVLPLYGTLWSYANGMESALVLFCFGWAAARYATRPVFAKRGEALVFGVALGLIVLARLDHIFVVGAAGAAIAGRAVVGRDGRRGAILCLAALCGVVILYIAVNGLFFQSVMPVSGKLKTTFPRITNANIDAFGALARAIAADKKWLFLGWRLAQMVVPPVCAAVYLLRAVRVSEERDGVLLSLRHGGDKAEHIMVVVALGVLGLGLYNFLFVPYGNQGHWYVPVSTLFVGLAAARWWGRAKWGRLIDRSPLGFTLATGVTVAFTLAVFAMLHRTPDYHARYAHFYFDVAPEVREHYRGRDVRLMSVDDGIVAFALGLPTMSGTGLVGDAEMIPHVIDRTTGNLAVERGVHYFTSLVYYDLSRFRQGTPSQSLGKWMSGPFRIKNPERYHFEVDFRRDGFAVVEVSLKTAGE